MAPAEPPPPREFAPHGLRDLSQGMSIAALAMLFVFVLAMLASILPGKLLDPAWQLAIVAALVDNAVIPLVALLTLHGAAWMNPEDQFSRKRQSAKASLLLSLSCSVACMAP